MKQPDFDAFDVSGRPEVFVVTMTEYQQGLKAEAAFPPLAINWPLARIIGEAGMRHLHIAETQKYAHVTYFFNGGREAPFSGEERLLIRSNEASGPDRIPEMRAGEILTQIIENLDRFEVIIANFANADMVGHSGNYSAAVRAVEILDQIVGELMNVILNAEGVMLITGDHGNIELKRNALTGEKLTEHSLNPVPFFLIGEKFRRAAERMPEEVILQKSEVGGILTDVAPTILDLLELQKPEEMSGTSLLEKLLKQP